MRHVPLAEFLNAFIDSGLSIDHVSEPDDEPVPHAIVVRATKTALQPIPSGPHGNRR